jgi:hypothetical protein
MKMEKSAPKRRNIKFKTSEYKIQMPGNHPEENIRHKEHGESFKSRILSQLLMSNCEQWIRKDAEGRKVGNSD